jgi:hypothetical protein
MPERSPGAALDQPTGCLPLPEGYRIVERRATADDSASRVDICSTVQQSI